RCLSDWSSDVCSSDLSSAGTAGPDVRMAARPLFRRLEEAALPVHIVATELKSGRAAILTSGPAVPALLASCAIPGVFPPVTIGQIGSASCRGRVGVVA